MIEAKETLSLIQFSYLEIKKKKEYETAGIKVSKVYAR